MFEGQPKGLWTKGIADIKIWNQLARCYIRNTSIT